MKTLIIVSVLSALVGSVGTHYYEEYQAEQAMQQAYDNANADVQEFMRCLGLRSQE